MMTNQEMFNRAFSITSGGFGPAHHTTGDHTMKFTTYKNVDGGTSMVSQDKALSALRELGHTFAVALAEIGHDTKESDLMSGLAAYHMLKLKGEDPRLDAAHRSVVREITNAMAER